MKKVYIISAIAALLCGLLVFKYVNDNNAKLAKLQEEKKIEMTGVVVAATEIPAFTPITKDMIKIAQYPAAYVHQDAARKAEDVIGKQANGTIAPGETIFTTVIGELEDIGESLSYKIPDGMRAMTVNLSTDSGVGGFITEGDFVDVLVYISTPEEEDKDQIKPAKGAARTISGGTTKVVTGPVKVLKTGNKGYDPKSGTLYSSITLALTPDQCNQLYTAMNQGSLYVTLRQINDESKVDRSIHSATELMGE